MGGVGEHLFLCWILIPIQLTGTTINVLVVLFDDNKVAQGERFLTLYKIDTKSNLKYQNKIGVNLCKCDFLMFCFNFELYILIQMLLLKLEGLVNFKTILHVKSNFLVWLCFTCDIFSVFFFIFCKFTFKSTIINVGSRFSVYFSFGLVYDPNWWFINGEQV